MDKKTIDWLLEQIAEFEKKEGKKGAIVKVQNRSLGSYYDTIAESEKVELKKWDGCELYLARFTKGQLEISACLIDGRYSKWYRGELQGYNAGTVCTLDWAHREKCRFFNLTSCGPWGQRIPYCKKWSRQPGNTGTFLPPPNCLPPRPVEKKKYLNNR